MVVAGDKNFKRLDLNNFCIKGYYIHCSRAVVPNLVSSDVLGLQLTVHNSHYEVSSAGDSFQSMVDLWNEEMAKTNDMIAPK